MPETPEAKAQRLQRLATIAAAAITRIEMTPDLNAKLNEFVKKVLHEDLELTAK